MSDGHAAIADGIGVRAGRSHTSGWLVCTRWSIFVLLSDVNGSADIRVDDPIGAPPVP